MNASPPASRIEAAAALLNVTPAELRSRLSEGPSASDRLLRVREAAALLSLSKRTVCELLRQGRLSRVRLAAAHARKSDGREVGGRIAVKLSEVEAIMAGTR